MFENILGQERPIRLLTNAIIRDRISQAYLFHGPEGIGKFTTALYFAMALNCHALQEKRPCGVCISCHKMLEFNHPDFNYIFPIPNYKFTAEGQFKENKDYNEYQEYLQTKKSSPWQKFYFTGNTEIRKDSITQLQHKLTFAMHENAFRICLIEDADQMNTNTANAFLKTLEEPPPYTVIILTTTKLQSLLPTIISRCQLVSFTALNNRFIEEILLKKHCLEPLRAKSISKIANGNLELAIRIAQDEENQARSLAFYFLQAAHDNDDVAVITNLIASKVKIKTDMLQDVISYLITWLNDLALYKHQKELLTNIDKLELMESFFQKNPSLEEKLNEGILHLEDIKTKIEGNVNKTLIIINTYNYLKQLLTS